MQETMKRKKIGKSFLSILLVVCLLFSAIPFSASAETIEPGSSVKTAEDYPLDGNNAGDYPASDQEGFVQMMKSANWSIDGSPTNLDDDKVLGYITLEVFGTPVGGDAGIDVLVIADLSGSMSNTVSPGYTRSQLQQDAVAYFIEMFFPDDEEIATGSRIAILPFGSNALTTANRGYADFTENTPTGKAYLLSQVRNNLVYDSNQGTNFLNAFTEAYNMFTRNPSNNQKVVLFVTDGSGTSGKAYAIQRSSRDRKSVV